MTLWLAAVALVPLAALPRRWWYVRLTAVLGWVAIWVDGCASTSWHDWIGAALVAMSMAALFVLSRNGASEPGSK